MQDHSHTIRCTLVLTVVAATLAALAVVGCSSSESGAAASSAAEPNAAAPSAAAPAEETASAAVEVAAEGTRFDPPRTRAEMPAGAWVCDMNGSVHYARGTEGDGECPVCGMHLVQHGGS